jgi:hypothetical protein
LGISASEAGDHSSSPQRELWVYSSERSRAVESSDIAVCDSHFHSVRALDVTLVVPGGEDDLIAIIDTGAKYCLFNGSGLLQ